MKRKFKVAKLKGGGADFGAKDKAQERANKGYGFTGAAVDKSTKQQTVNHNRNISNRTGKTKTINTIQNKVSGFQIQGPSIALSLAKQFIFDPLTKANRLRRAKGNMLIGGKKMPITRDYYRTENKPLDVMSKDGVQYQKDAGLISDKIPVVVGGDSEAQQKCPDGTFPPCITANKIDTNVVKPKNFFDFKAYNSGGVSSGPPPKKGPNSQVPPVKLSRGGGLAIRGTKFKGVF